MSALIPLAIAIPLLGAALLPALARAVSWRIMHAVAIAAAAATLACCGALLRESAAGPLVYWAGGWLPRGGISPGIGLYVDPVAAGLATLVAFLGTAALVFSWRYFDEVVELFGSLMLVFVGAMIGFCFSGDIFTLFVFFELMSVAAYALTAHKIEAASIEGSV